jgi:hypothetical protein
MEPYRIVLANEPRLLRGLLHYAFAKAAGFEVVDEIAPTSAGAWMDPVNLSDVVAEGKADWVIVSLWHNGDLPATLRQLVDAQPAVSLLGMAADGSRVKVYVPGAGDGQVLYDLSLPDLFTTLKNPRARRNSSRERE